VVGALGGEGGATGERRVIERRGHLIQVRTLG